MIIYIKKLIKVLLHTRNMKFSISTDSIGINEGQEMSYTKYQGLDMVLKMVRIFPFVNEVQQLCSM